MTARHDDWWTGVPEWARALSTGDAVAAVGHIDDLALRNLRVTRGYHALSESLAGLLGRDDANWCTFAIWASRSVGDILRGDELPARVRSWMTDAHDIMGDPDVIARVGPTRHRMLSRLLRLDHVDDAVADCAQRTAEQLSVGNSIVYAEIGAAVATYLDVWRDGDPTDPQARSASLAGTSAAEPVRGQNRLRAALSAWNEARVEGDPTRRSQLMLAGSLQMGAHEQWRLDGAITDAMGGGVDLLIEPFMRWCVPFHQIGPIRRLARSTTAVFDPELHEYWDLTMTKIAMTLELPGEVLHLGHDVTPRPSNAPLFATPLDVVIVDELADAVDTFDRTAGTGRGSAAADWTSYVDRMTYIVNLFRSRQRLPELFMPPFHDDAAAMIDAGELPSGDIRRLDESAG